MINLKNRNFLKLLDFTPDEIPLPDRPFRSIKKATSTTEKNNSI